MKQCSVCGSTIKVCKFKLKKPVCQKHYDQLRYHGKIVYIHKTNNEIVNYGDYSEIILTDRKGREKARAIIDTKNVDKVKNYKWCSSRNYVVAYPKNKRVMLHRIINNTPKGMMTDHIDHNTLNNIESNLRSCSQFQNTCNKKGLRGVRRTYNNKWSAWIGYKRRTLYLGTFESKADAIETRHEAERKLYGEFANIITI